VFSLVENYIKVTFSKALKKIVVSIIFRGSLKCPISLLGGQANRNSKSRLTNNQYPAQVSGKRDVLQSLIGGGYKSSEFYCQPSCSIAILLTVGSCSVVRVHEGSRQQDASYNS